MPMIDVDVPSDLFPDGVVAEDLTLALLRAEGVQQPAPVQLNSTATYLAKTDANKALMNGWTRASRSSIGCPGNDPAIIRVEERERQF